MSVHYERQMNQIFTTHTNIEYKLQPKNKVMSKWRCEEWWIGVRWTRKWNEGEKERRRECVGKERTTDFYGMYWLAGWLAGWLVGRSEGNDVCHNGGMRVLDFYPIYIHTQTSYTHFDRATFQFDEILEQSIKIPFFIIIIISIRDAYYYSTSWGVYCLFIAKNIKRHSNKIDILIIWPVWYCTQDAVVHMVNIYTHSYPHSAPYTHTFSVCVY